MNTNPHDEERPLSPVSRRAFLLAAPPTAVAGAALLAGCGSSSSYGDYADACIYCDSPGQDYEECDQNYCDYLNYGDAGP